MNYEFSGYAIKRSLNCIEVYNLESNLVLTVYLKTGNIAVHKLIPFHELLILLNLINKQYEIIEN